MERKTLATGPPRAMALASAETAARARRHQWMLTVPARTARTAVIIGPTTATAAESRRHAVLSSPKTTSAAPLLP
eukprot:10304308-Lingulodinium_polyedra.AAC.1